MTETSTTLAMAPMMQQRGSLGSKKFTSLFGANIFLPFTQAADSLFQVY